MWVLELTQRVRKLSLRVLELTLRVQMLSLRVPGGQSTSRA